MIGFIVVLLASLTTSDGPKSKEEFVKEFEARSELARTMAMTCISHTVNANDLETFLNTNPRAYLPYTDDQAKEFLHGRQGKAWGAIGKDSAYVITQTTDGICAVNAQAADRSHAINELKSLLDLLYSGHAVPFKPHENGPSNDAPPLIGWHVHDGRSNRYYSYSVVVANSDDAPAAAVYSVLVSSSGAP